MLSSCTNGIDLKEVSYDSLLHDYSSKVWMIDSKIVDGVDMVVGNDYEKSVIIFHDNGIVNMIPLKAIGEKDPVRGRYVLDSQNKELMINFDHEQWMMNIDYITEDSLFFVPKKGAKPGYSFKIKPLPPL